MNVKDVLAKQLHFFVENKLDFLDQHYPPVPPHSSERKKIDQLLDHYVQRISSHINRSDAAAPDFVFIGATVKIRDLDFQEEETYKICLPEESDPDKQCISFLSPVGRQLLLKQAGAEIPIETPAGPMRIAVSEIAYEP
jgi:transcription elongation factor GreA